MIELAPAKVNLCLLVGPARPDGRHQLATVFESVGLADELTIEPAARDEVACPDVPGPNLVQAALAHLRAAGWQAPPVRVAIRKRIPVAAGLGGGSADAAAMLRAAPALAPVEHRRLEEIAAALGSDAPSQLRPGTSLGTGAGERIEPVAVPPHGILVLPSRHALSTAAVYREADRLGLPRTAEELERRCGELRAALVGGDHGSAAGGRMAPGALPGELLVNDLQPASLSLCPSIGSALALARRVGADQALVCGSGPTVIGVFWGPDGLERARRALAAVGHEIPGAVAVAPIGGGEQGPGPNPLSGHGVARA